MKKRAPASTWQHKKDGLKRDLGLWAIRHEDVTAAIRAWSAFKERRDAQPRDNLGMLTAMVAFVADYGRLFSGETAIKGTKPWISTADAQLHKQLMDLRHEAVAHSDYAFRDVSLVPPGAMSGGMPPIPAHDLKGWRWLVRAAEINVDVEQVEHRLQHLQGEFARRGWEALDRLLEHCKGEILATTETPLDEF